MDINKFVEKFAEQFDDTAMEMFKPETKFRDLEEIGRASCRERV